MAEFPPELKKLIATATDGDFSPGVRTGTIEQIAKLGSREAFLALLGLAANDALPTKDRDLALKRAREVLKKSS